MKAYIFAAAALLGAVANGAVTRREEDCSEPGNGTLSSPTGADKSSGQDSLPCGATETYPYTVLQGDTLSGIVDKFFKDKGVKTGVCDIFYANTPKPLSDPNSLQPGQDLKIPSCVADPDNKSCIKPPPTGICIEVGGPTNYTIVSGDTLTIIGGKFNLTLAALLGDNAQITNPDAIAVDQIINLPPCPVCPAN